MGGRKISEGDGLPIFLSPIFLSALFPPTNPASAFSGERLTRPIFFRDSLPLMFRPVFKPIQ